jgi:hypothetical protein
MPETRRFPPPWSVDKTSACFIVHDANGNALTYVYFEQEPGRRSAAHLLTRDEARRIACHTASPIQRRWGRSLAFTCIPDTHQAKLTWKPAADRPAKL